MASTTTVNSSVANRTAVALKSGYDSYQPKGDLIFTPHNPLRKDEIFSIAAHDGAFSQVGEGANYPSVDISEVGTKTLSQAEYKKKLVITQLMKAFDNESAVLREAYMIGKDARLKYDGVMADVLNNAFTTTTTWDGDALVSTTHAIGSTAAEQSNSVSGALSDTTLNTAITALMTQKNHRNTNQPLLPRYLIVPPALGKKAHELISSPGNPEAANNNINTYTKFGIQVITWELLSSTTAWFLVADKMENALKKLVSAEPSMELRSGIYTESGSDEIRMYFALQAGAPDYLGFEGSLGT